MKKIIAILLAFGLIFCLCACGASEEKPETNGSTQSSVDNSSKENSKFTVTIVDQNGDPVVGALVKICQDETCLMPMPTDENGVVKFNFESTDGHKLALEGCPEGYETEYVGDNYLYLEDGETKYTFEITKK